MQSVTFFIEGILSQLGEIGGFDIFRLLGATCKEFHDLVLETFVTEYRRYAFEEHLCLVAQTENATVAIVGRIWWRLKSPPKTSVLSLCGQRLLAVQSEDCVHWYNAGTDAWQRMHKENYFHRALCAAVKISKNLILLFDNGNYLCLSHTVEPSCFVIYQNELYLFGPSNQAKVLSISSHGTNWRRLQNMPRPLSLEAKAIVETHDIYIFSDHRTYVYHPQLDSFSSGPTLPYTLNVPIPIILRSRLILFDGSRTTTQLDHRSNRYSVHPPLRLDLDSFRWRTLADLHRPSAFSLADNLWAAAHSLELDCIENNSFITRHLLPHAIHTDNILQPPLLALLNTKAIAVAPLRHYETTKVDATAVVTPKAPLIFLFEREAFFMVFKLLMFFSCFIFLISKCSFQF